jgi:outer membrane protein TolC
MGPVHGIGLVGLSSPTRTLGRAQRRGHKSLGIAESALFPATTAVALARRLRQNDVYAGGFYRDTVGLYQPELTLDYLIFDLAGRSGAIHAAKAEFQVEDIGGLPIPDALTDTVDQAVERALEQRPDLLEHVARLPSADASKQQATLFRIPNSYRMAFAMRPANWQKRNLELVLQTAVTDFVAGPPHMAS